MNYGGMNQNQGGGANYKTVKCKFFEQGKFFAKFLVALLLNYTS